MSETTFAFTDPRAQKVWSNRVFEYALSNMHLLPLVGTDPFAGIYKSEDLTRRPGGDVVVEIKNPLSGGGQGDNGTTESSEEALSWGNMRVRVHERAHSVISGGILAEQLTNMYKVTGFRQEAQSSLSDLMTEWMEDDWVATLSGLYNENSGGAAIETVNEAAPSASRIWYGGQSVGSTPALGNSGVSYASDATLTAGTATSNYFGTLVISKAKSLARQCRPKFRVIRFAMPAAAQKGTTDFKVAMPNNNFYVCLAHPDQIQTMKSELGTNGFSLVQQACQAQTSGHPLLAGFGAVLWDGVIVCDYERIHKRTGAGGTTLAEGFALNAGRTATTDACANARKVCRALFLGASAGCWAWAVRPQWSEGYKDNNKLRVKIDMVYGCAKTNFNASGTETPGEDYAVYCIDTEVP